MQIYTLGYSGAKPSDLLAFVEHLGGVLVDIRYAARSMYPAWNGQALRGLVGADRYMRLKALGNINYRNGGPILLAQPSAAILPLMCLPERCPIILLCGCADWHTCHRQPAAEYIQSRFGGEIVHLPSRFSEWSPATAA